MSYNNNISPLDSQKLNERVTALENDTGSTDNGPIYVDDVDYIANLEMVYNLKKAEIDSGATNQNLENRVVYINGGQYIPVNCIEVFQEGEGGTVSSIKLSFIYADAYAIYCDTYNLYYVDEVFNADYDTTSINWPE